MADPAKEDESGKDQPPKGRFLRFIQDYHTFFSSFVIGAAGLIATTLYQSKQQEIAKRQAEAQIHVSEYTADNQWKIERAEILSKNLQVLSGSGGDNQVERFGVLLSLTRGDIIDPELAISYALELGEKNPDYMRAILLNVVEHAPKLSLATDEHSADAMKRRQAEDQQNAMVAKVAAQKNWLQVEHNFYVPCSRRLGIARRVPLCAMDRFSERSNGIADLVIDELGAGNRGALSLLADEHQVQARVMTLSRLFAPYLATLVDRRQDQAIIDFEAFSTGAKLVAAIVLVENDGELVSGAEARSRGVLHDQRVNWLASYVLGKGCDRDCKGRLADLMLTDFASSGGAFDEPMRQLIVRADELGATMALGKIHARLLWCQLDPAAGARLRDKVLVPSVAATAAEVMKAGVLKEAESYPDESLRDVLDLLALVPEPAANTPEHAAWDAALAVVKKPPMDKLYKKLFERRDEATRHRASPPPKYKDAVFCGAASAAAGQAEIDDTNEDNP